MNAKIKLIAAIAALQLIVPAVLADPPRPVPGSGYQITGRVIYADPRSITLRTRGPNPSDFVILRREDTRFYSQIRPGDIVTIVYNMMATDVKLDRPEHVERVVPAYPVPPRYR
jgi:hypothetical protein